MDSSRTGGSDQVENLVIGGGQAGLAMGYRLAERGLEHLIVDAGPEVGHAWRTRWDSLLLFTSADYNSLPGMEFPGRRGTYPGKDEIADYLQAYAARFQLPIRLNTEIASLRREGGSYVAASDGSAIRANRVVVATGPFHIPFVPSVAENLDPELPQIHSSEYRHPEGVPEGRTLVVGGANSGQQIALELAKSRPVEIAVGEKLPTLPQRPFGRDIWWWLTTTRLSRVNLESRLGQRLSQRDVVIGGGLRELRSHGVGVRPRVISGAGRRVTFEDGSSSDYDAIIWATGFRSDYSWIEIPEIKDERGQIRHRRGVTESPGLYMLGLTWQYTRTSALLGWVGDDATFVAGQIASWDQAAPQTQAALAS